MKTKQSSIQNKQVNTGSELQSRSEQLGSETPKRDSLPRLDYDLRRQNRTLSTDKVLSLLQEEAPRFFELAEVVGNWVWIQPAFISISSRVLFISLISMPALQPPDSHHILAAIDWLELDNHLEANEELEKIEPELRAHPEVLAVRWMICYQAKKYDTCMETVVDGFPLFSKTQPSFCSFSICSSGEISAEPLKTSSLCLLGFDRFGFYFG